MSQVFHWVWIVVFALCICLATVAVAAAISEQRKQLRETAYQEGIGEEYDLELSRLHELERLAPKDASQGPNSYHQALENVRLRQRTISKNLASRDKLKPVSIHISNNTIAALNLGDVLGDLIASVQIIQSHGDQQIAEAIEKLSGALANQRT